MRQHFSARVRRALPALGLVLTLTGNLCAAPPRYIVDDAAYTSNATVAAAALQAQGRLVALDALMAQKPAPAPVKFATPSTTTVPAPELYDRLRAGTVAIGAFYHCHNCGDWHLNLATGFAVAEDGIVSTSAHVLACDEAEMKEAFAIAVDSEGHVFPVETLFAHDTESDTCLVRVAGAKLRVLPLRAGAQPGERVYCLSHPSGHYYMFSQGIVARVSRLTLMPEDETKEARPKSRPTLALEVTSEYSPGSSGGPIADEHGNIVAQVDAIETNTDPGSNATSGVVIARTATAAEEILRLADPALRTAPKPLAETDPAAALAALQKAVAALQENTDEDAADALLAKVVRAVRRARPVLQDSVRRREFALLAAEGLADDHGNKALKPVLPVLEEIAADKTAPPEQQRKAGHWLVTFAAYAVDGPEKFTAWEKKYLAHATAFPDDALSELKLIRLQLAQEYAPAWPALAEQLATDKDAKVATEARAALDLMQSRRALEGAPLELKFTALDRREVDLAKLRGQVVLLDFWATWCSPCLAELPHVKQAYDKLHPRGFEIIGISLDENQDKLEALLKKKGMTWPQHFDGKGWNGELAKRFGVTGIPTMVLLDKKGFVRDFNASGDQLEGKIEKLLAE